MKVYYVQKISSLGILEAHSTDTRETSGKCCNVLACTYFFLLATAIGHLPSGQIYQDQAHVSAQGFAGMKPTLVQTHQLKKYYKHTSKVFHKSSLTDLIMKYQRGEDFSSQERIIMQCNLDWKMSTPSFFPSHTRKGYS